MLKRLSLLFLLVLSLVGCSSLDEAKMGYGAVNIYLEPNVKLEDVDWPSDYIYYTTCPMSEFDIAVTHSYHYRGSVNSSDEVLIANFIETKLTDSELNDYYKFKSNGGTIEDFLKNSGKLLVDEPVESEEEAVESEEEAVESEEEAVEPEEKVEDEPEEKVEESVGEEAVVEGEEEPVESEEVVVEESVEKVEDEEVVEESDGEVDTEESVVEEGIIEEIPILESNSTNVLLDEFGYPIN